MSGLDLARLKEAVAGRTAGEWRAGDGVHEARWVIMADDRPVASTEMAGAPSGDEQHANVRAIVALVNAADELIAAAEKRDRMRAAFHAADRSLRTLIDHFDAMDGEEDSAALSADLTSIAKTLRAALKEKP